VGEPPDREAVAAAVGRIAAQRVLATPPGRQEQLEVAAWLPTGQLRTRRVGQQEAAGVGRLHLDLVHYEPQVPIHLPSLRAPDAGTTGDPFETGDQRP
jgi:hypothetical protein